MDTEKKLPRTWRFLIGALIAALGFASWSAWGSSGCQSCQGAAEILQGSSLAVVGVLYYSVLLAVAILGGPSLFVTSGIFIAAGLHSGLLVILVQAKLFCGPCIATAAAALVAFVLAIKCEPRTALRASWMLPGASFALQSWVLFSGALPPPVEAKANSERVVRQEELALPPVERGKVRMVVYTRPDCGYCMELEKDVMPELEREFGSRLTVERRAAESLPGIPTPTIILTGHEQRRMFPGLPPREDLVRAIETVMGEDHGRETVFEKSR